MSAEGAEATGGEGVVDELLAVVLAASPGTPTLTCRTIAEAVAARVQQAEAERDDWKDSAQRRWDRARAAEAERDALRERVEALDNGHSDPCTHPDEPCVCSVPLFDLRAALDGPRGAA